MHQKLEEIRLRFTFALLLVLLFYMPAPVWAAVSCNLKAAPRISVTPVKSQIKYNFTKTKADLNKINVDTISPYGPHHKTNVSGLMSGSIQLASNVSFMQETYDSKNQGCLYLKAVNVKIHIDPTIYIAREFPKSSCMHNAILAHEFKHVEVDRLIVNKYINLIGRALGKEVDRQSQRYGPMKIIRIAEVQEDIKKSIYDVVLDMNDDMNRERRRRQQAVDTLEEYDSIGVRCKREKALKR